MPRFSKVFGINEDLIPPSALILEVMKQEVFKNIMVADYGVA